MFAPLSVRQPGEQGLSGPGNRASLTGLAELPAIVLDDVLAAADAAT